MAFSARVRMTTPVNTPSYMSSFLLLQQEKLQATFSSRYPGPWLLWEPGAWSVGSSLKSTIVLSAPISHVRSEEALCFMLSHRPHFTVGREPSNTIVVNDSTVSRHHLELELLNGQWHVKPVGGRVVLLHGQRVADEGAPLHTGTQLQLGNVTLSFYDSAQLLIRLREGHKSRR